MINAYAKTSIIIWRYSFDIHGEPVSPTSETVDAIVEDKTTRITDKGGEDYVSQAMIRLKVFDLTYNDKIELGGVKFPIQKIAPKKAFTKTYYVEVYL